MMNIYGFWLFRQGYEDLHGCFVHRRHWDIGVAACVGSDEDFQRYMKALNSDFLL